MNRTTEKADSYRDTLGIMPIFTGADGYCQPNIPVLDGLYGKPWDDLALAFVSTLRPSFIRVTTGDIKTDSRLWRVTVWLEPDGRTIQSIDQEVLAYGSDGNGGDMSRYYDEEP